MESCPYCGHPLAQVADAVDVALHRAVECGVKVSIMERTELLDRAGGVAAVLRY
jgi:peptide subunit release factor 1 (eRF1)